MSLRRIIDYVVIGLVTGGVVFLAHLLETTTLTAVALAFCTTLFTVMALMFNERTEEEKMFFVIEQLLDHGIGAERIDEEEEDAEEEE